MMLALAAIWAGAKKAAIFLYDHWYLPLFAVGVALGWFFTRCSGGAPQWSAKESLVTELAAIKAGAEVRTVKAEAGSSAAKAHVEEQHKEALAALDERQRKEAAAYEKDPAELARFLVRAAKR